MRDVIEARITHLRGEVQTASDELSKLRPRVQYLEQTMLRLDGALTVLHELLATEPTGGRQMPTDGLALAPAKEA